MDVKTALRLLQEKKRKDIEHKKLDLTKQLSDLKLPQAIKPKFSINFSRLNHEVVVSIQNGSCGYRDYFLNDINLEVKPVQELLLKEIMVAVNQP